MSDRKTRRPDAVSVPVRMPSGLDKRITEAADQLGLSKQDTMRLSMERGLKVLVAQLNGHQAAA